jgi:hypothetical protein
MCDCVCGALVDDGSSRVLGYAIWASTVADESNRWDAVNCNLPNAILDHPRNQLATVLLIALVVAVLASNEDEEKPANTVKYTRREQCFLEKMQ